MAKHSKFKGYRLVRQIEQSDFEYREYGVERMRMRSYYDLQQMMLDWDNPERSNYRLRTWKQNRKTQYKTKDRI